MTQPGEAAREHVQEEAAAMNSPTSSVITLTLLPWA